MRRLSALLFAALFCLLPQVHRASGQGNAPSTPTSLLEGLLTRNHHGSFADAATLPDGSLVLLFNAGDGLRLLKTTSDSKSVLAQTLQGASGDIGIALTSDGAGNLYVAGTSNSGQLHGTAGAVFPSPADTTTNAFVARFDANLNLVFLSFLGVGKTEVNALAVTPDAIFVTGVTYASGFPATPGAFQTSPSNPGEGNAFVERFSSSGSALVYATFLDAPGGTTPETITADSADRAYIAGSTSSSSYPTRKALQPQAAGAVSGFLTQLTAGGSDIAFSTFLAGTGISSIALDPTSGSLILSGNLDPAHVPLAHATATPGNLPYQSVLRLSADGQTFVDSTLLLPGNVSYLQPAADGSIWVTGSLALPLAPAADLGPGDAYALHVATNGLVDKFLRLGGTVTRNPAYATLQTTLATPVLSPDGRTVYLPGTVGAHTAASLQPGQTLDLALNPQGSALLPNTASDLLPASCAPSDDCSGTGGLLTLLAPATASPFLTFSSGDSPNILLRNIGPASAAALAVTLNGLAPASTCPQTLAPAAQCVIQPVGTGSGSLTLTAAGSAPITLPLAPASNAAYPLALDTATLDFGIVTPSSPAARTVTVTNLSSSPQTFTSQPANVLSAATYTLAETGGTCAGTSASHTIHANASCSLVVTLSPSPLPTEDGPILADWQVGARTLPVTGYAQSAALSLSAAEIDFGPQPTSSSGWLPRFLYLSNNSAVSVPHATVTLPPGSPFSLLDNCPASLAPQTVCSLAFGYAPTTTPTFDSLTVLLDNGLSVLLTGESLPPVTGSLPLAPSPLTVSPYAVVFPQALAVTTTSASPQSLQLTNESSIAVPLSTVVLGDFAASADCGSSLAAGATCTISLSFSPSLPGTRLGLLLLSTGPGTQPVEVSLSGTATSILGSDASTLDLEQTVVAEPALIWIQLQGIFASVTSSVADPGFSVALLADSGSGHGTLPDTAFGLSATAPCTNCWLAVRYLPTSAGLATGTLHLRSGDAGNGFKVGLQATALPAQGIVLAPVLRTFNTTNVGSSSAPATFSLTNLLPKAAATVQQINSSGDFTVLPSSSAIACSRPLPISTACAISVVFSPTASGRRTGTLQIVTDAGTVSAALSGTAIPSLAASNSTVATTAQTGITLFPAQADFGASAVGSLAGARQFTLTNATSVSQTISFTASANFPFATPIACLSLVAGASCTFTVAFLPQAAGPLTGSVLVSATPADGSPSAQSALYLRGYGIASASLSFSDGTSPLTPLDFGTVASGSSATKNVIATNTGSIPVTLRRLTSTAPFQTTSTCTAPLAPGATCTFAVSYAAANPTAGSVAPAPQPDTGTLLVETDAAGSPATLYFHGIAAVANSPVQPPSLPTFTLSQGALTFANTPPGAQPAQQTVTVTNKGTTAVSFLAVQTTADYIASSSCTILQPAATCAIYVTFQPAEQSAAPSSGTLTIVSNSATAVNFVTLLGSSLFTQLQLSAVTLDFGSVPLGSFAQRSLVLTNPSLLPILPGKMLTSGDFSADAGTCPTGSETLAAGATCTAILTFTPSAAGPRSGSLTLGTSTAQPVALTGVGLVGHLVITPTTVSFGALPLTSTATQTLTLTNTGDAPLSSLSTAITGASSNDYTLSSNCTSSLPAGARCLLTLTFTPSAAGTRLATLDVTSTDPASPLQIPITGTGAPPPGFALTVDGGTSGAATIQSGASANFALMLTPWGGYSGTVALTCKPLAPAPNASCMLANAQIGPLSGPMPSSATLVTLSGLSSTLLVPLALPFLSLGRKSRYTSKRNRTLLAIGTLLGLTLASALAGCGSGVKGSPYTPPGTYRYQITATSLSGAALSSTVTIEITVQ